MYRLQKYVVYPLLLRSYNINRHNLSRDTKIQSWRAIQVLYCAFIALYFMRNILLQKLFHRRSNDNVTTKIGNRLLSLLGRRDATQRLINQAFAL
jgi:hypothetical protein